MWREEKGKYLDEEVPRCLKNRYKNQTTIKLFQRFLDSEPTHPQLSESEKT